MRKIKVVQIGLGHDHSKVVLESLLRQKDIFDVVAIAVPDCELEPFAGDIHKYRDVKKIPFLSIEEALNIPNLDGAIIETEEFNLTKYAIMAAEKGLNIHMDKPSGLEHSDFQKLIKILKSKNLVFTTGYMYRFNPVVMDAIKKVKNGDIGKVYAVEAQMSCEHTKEKSQWLDRFPGGMTFFLGCHLVDLIYQIQGEPQEVLPLNSCTGKDGVTSEDYGMVVFKYPNGVSFAKSCTAEPGGFRRRHLIICGERGTIEIRPLEINAYGHPNYAVGDQQTKVREVYADTGWDADGQHKISDVYNRYDGMMKNFAEIVCGEKENPYTYDYELNLNKLVLKACGKDLNS